MNAFRLCDHIAARLTLRVICASCCKAARSAGLIWKTIRAYKTPTVYVACRRYMVQCATPSHTLEELLKPKPEVRQTIRWFSLILMKSFLAETSMARLSH